MKTSKLFTLDQNIAERLQNINASELVNRLLKDHFAVFKPNNSLLDEKQAIIKQILKKKDRFLRRLGLLKSGMILNLITMLRLGSKLVKKIQQTPKFYSTLKTEISKSQQKSSEKDMISIKNTEKS